MGVIRPKLVMESICSCGYGWSVVSFVQVISVLLILKKNQKNQKTECETTPEDDNCRSISSPSTSSWMKWNFRENHRRRRESRRRRKTSKLLLLHRQWARHGFRAHIGVDELGQAAVVRRAHLISWSYGDSSSVKLRKLDYGLSIVMDELAMLSCGGSSSSSCSVAVVWAVAVLRLHH